MTKIRIEYDTETGRGRLTAEHEFGVSGAWSLSEDIASEIETVLTGHYGPLDGTGCGWSRPGDDDHAYFGEQTRAPF